MNNKFKILLILVVLFAAVFASFLILKTRKEKFSILADTSVNLCVSDILWSDFNERAKNLKNINILPGETCPNQLGLKTEIKNSEQVVYEKWLDLIPEDFGKFYQGNLVDSAFYIVLSQENANQNIYSEIKNEYAKNPPKLVKMVAGGDVSLARYIDYKIEKNGPDYCFENIKNSFLDSDIGFVNLESPFGYGQTNHDRNSMIFSAETENAPILKNAGINVVNLANNHFGNQGQAGMKLTFETLEKKNIKYFGAGENDVSAHTALIKEVNGLKIAFLGYTDNDVLASGDIAGANHAGVADFNGTNLVQDIETAKQKADMVVISMHSGTEYTPYANRRQINFAHKAIDSGTDLVIGHHSHVVQGVENYKGKFIFYSLGNLVFDQPWSEETKQSILLEVSFLFGKVVSLELKPVYIKDFCQPQLASGDLLSQILQRIFSASERLR